MGERFVFVLESRDADMVSTVHGIYSSREIAVGVALGLAKETIQDVYADDGIQIDREDGSRQSVVIRLLSEDGNELSERWTIWPEELDADAPQAAEPTRPPQDQYLAGLRAGLDEASGLIARPAESGAKPEQWR